MTCTCEAVLRANAAQLLADADRLRKRYPKAAAVNERHALSLALAAGHLHTHHQEQQT